MIVLLQNVGVMIHHEQQQVLDLCFGGQKIAKRAAANAESRGNQQREELAALIPTVGAVGAGRRRKTTRDELAKQD